MKKTKLQTQEILEKLLQVNRNNPNQEVKLKEQEIIFVIQQSLEIIKNEPNLLILEAPIIIVGDIHGQYHDLLRIFDVMGFPSEKKFLFLGDYVDRGKLSIETMSLLLSFKIRYPQNIFLLRGNHECSLINRIYGFFDECNRRYSKRLWKLFSNLFNYLPLSAKIDERILCMHGGLSPDLLDLKQINQIKRPQEVPEYGIMCDLLWADPCEDTEMTGWGENERGVSYVFNGEIVKLFLQQHDLDLVVRAHQVVEDGYEFFGDRSLVTIFSAPNYCGEFDNAGKILNEGGIMNITENLTCSFFILQPHENPIEFNQNS